MKNSKILLLLAFLTAGLLVGQKAQAQRGGSVSFQYFYNELSPYGNWTSHPRYGSVWTPYDVGRNFQPYGTDGSWVMTEFGNTWVSNFPWGWAAFHYGRWFYDDYLGWAWVPGYEWGPAWVDWRSDNNYYGWAPLWPGVQTGVSFNIPLNYWVFVPQRYLYRRSIFGYCVPRYRYRSFFGNTTVINNYFYNDNRSYTYVSGPSRGEVERVTRGNVPTYRAEDVRSNRYADSNGSGSSNRTYRADDYSRSGLDRQSRDNGGSNGRSNDSGTSGRSSRTYDANDSGSSNGRRSYDSSSPSSGRSSGTPSHDSNESRSRSNSSTPSYDSGNRSRSNNSNESSPGNDSRSRSGAPSAPEMRSAPSRSGSSDSNSSRSRSSSEYSAPSRSSVPSMSTPPSRSSAPAMSSPPSRSSAPSMSSPPSRSSAPSVSSPSPSRSSSQSSPSPASSSPSRSRGPR